MTSLTYFYRKSLFSRASINLVIFLLFYLAIVRPLRLQVTERVVHPVLSILFNDAVEVSILAPHLPIIALKFQDIDDSIPVITPFGLYWGIPFVLLASIRSWRLVKTLTNFHIALTFILPILLSLFFIRWVWTFIPTDIFSYLTQFIGMSFCIFSVMEFCDEHHRIKKAIGVGGGVR